MTAEKRRRVAPTPRQTVMATPAELFAFGKQAHQAGDIDGARKVYSKLIEILPDDLEVLHFFGILKCQSGKPVEGLAMIESTLRSDAAVAGWWVNYGNVLRQLKRPNDAIDAYKEAILREPHSADAYSNLGIVQQDKFNYDIAVACFRKALEFAPEHGLAWSNLGNLLIKLGQTEQGVHALFKSLATVKFARPEERQLLAIALSSVGETERACALYREWLAEEPGNPTALHHLAALSGEPPPRAADNYVAQLFDRFAVHFDEKLANLGYVAPALVNGEVASALGAPGADRLIADAGCGTGLCGPGLRPFARRLIGIDLSRKMVKQARLRGCYDTLTIAELTAYFAATKRRHDVIVCADTLCYFGALADVTTAFARALRPGGELVFTVEAQLDGESGTYSLNANGRYTHTETYVRNTLAASGFAIKTFRRDVLRKESGKDVAGYLVRAAV